MRIIEQIGSYAGLAAIPGLAVLSVLYFSQARDVRRLREWAGRAPERATEQAMGGRVAVQPGQAAEPAQAGQAVAPQPAAAAQQPVAAGATAAKPAVAAAAATGAKPVTATAPAPAGAAATPAGRAAAALGDAEKAATGDGAGKDDTPVPEHASSGTNGTTEGAEAEEGAAVKAAGKPAGKPAALTPAAVASAAAGAAKSAAGHGVTGTAAATRPGPPAVGARPATAGVTAPRRQIPSLPSSSRTSVLGAGASPAGPWYRRLGARLPAGRYIALIVAGALVLGGGAAFAISQLAGGNDGKSASPGASNSPGAPAQPNGNSSTKKGSNSKSTPTVDPSKVTVTVVNGTTIPNLARDTATKLSGFGFQIGNKVTGTGSLAAAESVVEYKPGFETEARFVAAKLNISQKQPADPDAIAQAGAAQVIAVLGADQAPGG